MFVRDNRRYRLLTMSFMERDVDKAHPSSRGTLRLTVLEKSDGTPLFPVMPLPDQWNKLLKASTKAIKDSAINF